jgi:hypothetical protein
MTPMYLIVFTLPAKSPIQSHRGERVSVDPNYCSVAASCNLGWDASADLFSSAALGER